MKLVPEAIIFGKVQDQNGQPLQGLPVQLKRFEVHNGLRHWQEVQSTTTNVEGEYRFFELEAGKYSLAPGFQIDGPPDTASAVAFAPVVYPSLSGNDGLSLSGGDPVEANLNPPSQKLYAVTGHIEGSATLRVNFEAERSSGGLSSPVSRFNRSTGDYRLLLPSGSYRLKIHGVVQREQLFATREISIGEAPLKNVSITLGPLATVPVEVDFQGSDIPSQEIQPLPAFFVNVELEETDPSGLGRAFHPDAAQGPPDRPIAIRNLEPGQYRLVATPPPPWYLASAVSVLSTCITKQTGDIVYSEARRLLFLSFTQRTTMLYALERESNLGSTSAVLVELSEGRDVSSGPVSRVWDLASNSLPLDQPLQRDGTRRTRGSQPPSAYLFARDA